jgi:hypothetical protein
MRAGYTTCLPNPDAHKTKTKTPTPHATHVQKVYLLKHMHGTAHPLFPAALHILPAHDPFSSHKSHAHEPPVCDTHT